MPSNPAVVFPAITLSDLQGGLSSLASRWAEGPALILVGHRDCKTTRETLPLLDRIHSRRGDDASVLAVLQDDPATASALVSQLALALPIALDRDPYPLAAALALEVVPALYLVERGGSIVGLSEGLRRADLERFATRLGVVGELFAVDDRLPAFRPG